MRKAASRSDARLSSGRAAMDNRKGIHHAAGATLLPLLLPPPAGPQADLVTGEGQHLKAVLVILVPCLLDCTVVLVCGGQAQAGR